MEYKEEASISLFTHLKTNTKSFDIYSTVSMLCPLNRTKILWKLENGLTKIKQKISKYFLSMDALYIIPSLQVEYV